MRVEDQYAHEESAKSMILDGLHAPSLATSMLIMAAAQVEATLALVCVVSDLAEITENAAAAAQNQFRANH